ncbi:MAG TPA: acetyl-coenzyme A synthetase N-terminal domain-containing protein, partial [Nitrososphaeraceae archaeon]|nr:acetyl-coenzyme A synthetase N-terminal domain-containing protein [Nitrososphaeraceae archaeon]
MPAASSNLVYIPTYEKIINSNISIFMRKHGITDYSQLIRRSTENMEWYWNAIIEYLNLEWYRKYDQLFDSSGGIPCTRWFIDGKCNIIANVIEKHAKYQPCKIAYI